jgi:uncharacterized protein (TIGR02246 family)
MAFSGGRGVFAVLLLVLVALPTAWAKPKESHEADSTAIQKLFTDFNSAFNNHDAHAVASLFIDDADFITVGGAKFRGGTAIEQHLAPLFAGRAKALHRDASMPDIHFLRPDTAIVECETETSGIGGTDAPPVKGLYDWVVMKEKGRWLIAVWHESNLSTPAGQPANR